MNNSRNSPLSSCKNLPPIFFMGHLLHRLYGVDAPGGATYTCKDEIAHLQTWAAGNNLRLNREKTKEIIILCTSEGGAATATVRH